MRLCLLLAMLFATQAIAEEWSAPEKPDPSAILQEARKDFRAERYEEALAKHVWYHENALKYDQSLYGVRLSFAVSDWHKLGKSYTPALTKLIETRDEAAKKVIASKGSVAFQYFHDVVAINRWLGKETHTLQFFKVLDSEHPKLAKRVYPLAQPVLVKAKAYELCGKYLDPEQSFESTKAEYRMHRNLSKKSLFGLNLFGLNDLENARVTFSYKTKLLVTILVFNKQDAKAREIVNAAKEEWDDAAFHAKLEKALKQKAPAPQQ